MAHNLTFAIGWEFAFAPSFLDGSLAAISASKAAINSLVTFPSSETPRVDCKPTQHPEQESRT